MKWIFQSEAILVDAEDRTPGIRLCPSVAPNVFVYVITQKSQPEILSFLKMHALIVKTVIYLIFALVYKPLNDVISIILGRTLEMLSHALVENTFSDFFFFFMAHERFGDLFS